MYQDFQRREGLALLIQKGGVKTKESRHYRAYRFYFLHFMKQASYASKIQMPR